MTARAAKRAPSPVCDQRDHRDENDQLDEKAHCVFLHQGLFPGRSPDDADAALHGDGEKSRRPRQTHQPNCGCQKAQPVAEVSTRSDGAAEWSEKSCDQPVDLRNDPGIGAKERRRQAEGEEYRRCDREQERICTGGSVICKLVFPVPLSGKEHSLDHGLEAGRFHGSSVITRRPKGKSTEQLLRQNLVRS